VCVYIGPSNVVAAEYLTWIFGWRPTAVVEVAKRFGYNLDKVIHAKRWLQIELLYILE